MSGKWQPGDVALVRNEYNVWNVAICAVRRGRRGFVWSYGVADSESPIEADARPLVVVDPEDAEQVEAMARALTQALLDVPGGGCMRANTVQAALREFADPPTVFDHFPRETPSIDGKSTISLCGKVWTADETRRSEGKCPECVAAVEARWVR